MLHTVGRHALRSLARSALAQYDLHTVRLRLRSAKEHALFQIDAIAAVAPQRFALRVYDPAVFDAASVQTEIAWLRALVNDAGLLVPEPVPARNGAYVVYAAHGDAGVPHASALFRWVRGRRRAASLSPQAMERVGAFAARLHLHSERFQPAHAAAAQRWDWERVFGGTSLVGAPEASSPLAPDQQHVFRSIGLAVRSAMQALGRSSSVWGLVHADLHSSNYLFCGASVGAIDFEDCGWGYYLYDVAVILDEVYAAHGSRAEPLRAALLHGYQQVRPLSQEHTQHLDTFIAMRLAELVRWHATSTNPHDHASAAQLANEMLAFVQQHLPAIFL